MKESNPQELVSKFLSGNMNEQEQVQFMSWLEASSDNKTLLEDAEKVWQWSDQYETPSFEVNTAKAWEKVDRAIENIPAKNGKAPTATIRKLPLSRQLLRIAAVFMVVSLTAWWFLQSPFDNAENSMILVKTESGESKEVVLPDETKVWLNGFSELAYDKNFEERKVELRGEAFFDVAREEDRPFEIFTGAAKTVVLGTAFNIRAYTVEEEIEVSVVRGKVALVKKEEPDKTVILNAGNTGIYQKAFKTVSKVEKPIQNVDSWKTQQLKFDNTQMGEVLESLERYFRIDIEVENKAILNCHLTGNYQNPQLDQILNVLEFGVNVKIEKENDQYLLQGEGCN